MILFISKREDFAQCPQCEALEKRIDLDNVLDLTVCRIPRSGRPDSDVEAGALAEADFYDVFSVPALIVDEEVGSLTTDVFEILEYLQSKVRGDESN